MGGDVFPGETTGSGRSQGGRNPHSQEKASARSEVRVGGDHPGCGGRWDSPTNRSGDPSEGDLVDLVLKLRTLEIAVQIAVTSPIDLEVPNPQRCLDAGYREVVLLCDATAAAVD